MFAVSRNFDDLSAGTRDELVGLLGANRVRLVAKLMHDADMVSTVASYEKDWREPELKRVRRLAQQLDAALAALPLVTHGMLRHGLEEEESSGVITSEDGPEIVPWYFDCFVEQLRYIASPALVSKRAVGRQREDDRDRLAAQVARAFRDSGLRPSKYENGRFIKALAVLLKFAGFGVPANLYRIAARAIDATQESEADSRGRVGSVGRRNTRRRD